MWRAVGTCRRDFTGVCGLGRMHLTTREKNSPSQRRESWRLVRICISWCVCRSFPIQGQMLSWSCAQEGVSERDDNTLAQGNLQMMVSGRHRSRGESKYCFLHLGSFLKLYIYECFICMCICTPHGCSARRYQKRASEVGFQIVVNHHVGTEFELQSLGRTTGALNIWALPPARVYVLTNLSQTGGGGACL